MRFAVVIAGEREPITAGRWFPANGGAWDEVSVSDPGGVVLYGTDSAGCQVQQLIPWHRIQSVTTWPEP